MQAAGRSVNQPEIPVARAGREARWIADAFDNAQRIRRETGERIRSIASVRTDAGIGGSESRGASPDPDTLLRRIETGETDGPVPLLGRVYRRQREAERELFGALHLELTNHPAWPWLSRVEGVDPELACTLLARLDPRRAETPSAFWSYCGLATVPGAEYRCSACGYTAAFPVGHSAPVEHTRLGSANTCSGKLAFSRGPEKGVRVAQPPSTKGEKGGYDPYAKKACYLLGASFLKTGGPYASYYQRERTKLDADRPGWSASRKHLTALRKTEKLFLAHLWLVWREALGLPVTAPHEHATREQTADNDPWSMVAAPRPPAAGSGGAAGSAAGERPRAEKAAGHVRQRATSRQPPRLPLKRAPRG